MPVTWRVDRRRALGRGSDLGPPPTRVDPVSINVTITIEPLGILHQLATTEDYKFLSLSYMRTVIIIAVLVVSSSIHTFPFDIQNVRWWWWRFAVRRWLVRVGSWGGSGSSSRRRRKRRSRSRSRRWHPIQLLQKIFHTSSGGAGCSKRIVVVVVTAPYDSLSFLLLRHEIIRQTSVDHSVSEHLHPSTLASKIKGQQNVARDDVPKRIVLGIPKELGTQVRRSINGIDTGKFQSPQHSLGGIPTQNPPTHRQEVSCHVPRCELRKGLRQNQGKFGHDLLCGNLNNILDSGWYSLCFIPSSCLVVVAVVGQLQTGNTRFGNFSNPPP